MSILHLYSIIESPLGNIAITSYNEFITGVYTVEHNSYLQAQQGIYDPLSFIEATNQLHEYFEGKRKTFDLQIAPESTAFQKRVWDILLKIPYGQIKTYGEIARMLNDPNSSRAVGLANGKNPLSIIIPCHRVVGTNGKLTGYAGGIKAKEWLLHYEAQVSGLIPDKQLSLW